jgi:glycosyltransferase
MKISIITVTYNSANTITDCISSVNKQTYSNIEHIIVDGASKDNTVELIKAIPNRVATLISEPDKGIYDAMNKGILLATGDVIGILNSDDFYANEFVIEEIISCFLENDVDCVFGNINYVSKTQPNRIIRKWTSGNYKSGSFKKGWHPAHPAFFVKKSVFNTNSAFDLKFKLAADFELMLRLLEKQKISNMYYNKVIVHMRLGGATSGSFKNILIQNIECYNAFKRNEIKITPLYILFRILPKIKQFFNK